MKKLSLFILSVIIFSCGEKESSEAGAFNMLENFSFTVDTVVVDPGEEIINLSQRSRLASTDESKTYFYLLDSKAGHVNKVNLDELKLEEIIPFEKEGPNGIGTSFHIAAKVLPGEDFLFTSFRESGIFSREGKLIKNLQFKPEEMKIEGLDEAESRSLLNQLILTKDQKTVFSLPSNYLKGKAKLVRIDLENSSGEILETPAFDIVEDYSIIHDSEGRVSISPQAIFMQEIGDHIYISTQPTNKIYKYDFPADSLTLVAFDFTIVPNQKEIPIQNKVSSMEEFQSQMEKANTQIGFDRLIFDEENNRFYRFGRIYEPKKEGQEGISKAQVFLFAFDDQLNLIGETEIPELDQVPTFPFFKDGKLWSYVNVEDELGFAVFTFNI